VHVLEGGWADPMWVAHLTSTLHMLHSYEYRGTHMSAMSERQHSYVHTRVHICVAKDA